MDKKVYIIGGLLWIIMFFFLVVAYDNTNKNIINQEINYVALINDQINFYESKINDTLLRFKTEVASYKDEVLLLRDGVTLPDGRFVIDKKKQKDMLLANKVLSNYMRDYGNTEVELLNITVFGPDNDKIIIMYGIKKDPNEKKIITKDGKVEYIS